MDRDGSSGRESGARNGCYAPKSGNVFDPLLEELPTFAGEHARPKRRTQANRMGTRGVSAAIVGVVL
jgi:hypothetical protein